MPADRLRQITYSSRAADDVDADAILQVSRHNNALDGITGILVIEGQAITQVLEGPGESVAAAFIRIARDPRHSEVTLLSDREIEERDFGYWSMELADRLRLEPEQRRRLARRLAELPEALRRSFDFGPGSATAGV
ncbi:Sensors of blue-light using FAD [Sphingomonas guangdongensis]|uniref:Sensors of blue-light using FAD n=1 Tax=Sphingomonas guangdongensis TaxID=1141890 RepID=A0A285QZM1_9SPHN|nr:BLUF domain-containing protein [Sphingomonas guangdongensis]SOB86938.1 Sensors of blue-light using FAD [Sphingomonas guangdongensis]